MNIISARVIDPRKNGQLIEPFLEVHVDDFVEELTDTIYPKKFRLVHCGPFAAVEVPKGDGEWVDADYEQIGEFNSLNLLDDQLAPVRVVEMVSSGDTLDLTMRVQRYRRLMRKMLLSTDWELTASEPAALRGRIQWRLELRNPVCYSGAMTSSKGNCSQPVKATVVVDKVHIPLCHEHMREHQNRLRSARINS